MTKDNVLFTIIGLLLGVIVGFMFANTVNQRGYERRATLAGAAQPQQAGAGSNLPADHPELPSNAVAEQGGRIPPEIQTTIQRAKDQPSNFEAQMAAGELYYRIKRFDEAIEYFTRASQLRPDNYDVLVNLGNVNFDAEKFDAAEKAYTAALVKKPNDVNVRTDLGLTFVYRKPENYDRAIAEFRRSLEVNPKHEQTLQNITFALVQKQELAEAQKMLERLTEVNPRNTALAGLQAQINGAPPAK